MVQSVNCCWTQVLVNPSCQNHFICDVNHYTPYQNCCYYIENTSGNGHCIGVLFIIPVIVQTHSHRFEIYTLVSEIHENVDLVLGIRNVFELEGVINSRDC